MKRVGGHKTRNKVDRMLLKLFTPYMLTRLSMKGQRNDKQAFIESPIADVVITAAKHITTNSVSESEIEECIASILKGASARKAVKE